MNGNFLDTTVPGRGIEKDGCEALIQGDMVDRAVFVLGTVTTRLGSSLTGLPIYEAAESPGGICCSYYLRPGGDERLPVPPADDGAYRFVWGGWADVKSCTRKSAVWFPHRVLLVPHPVRYQTALLRAPSYAAVDSLQEA